MNVLQNFIFIQPESMTSISDDQLFFRGIASQQQKELFITGTVHFNTFFNLFPVQHFIEHSNIENLFLSITGIGDALLCLYGVNILGEHRLLQRKQFTTIEKDTVLISVLDFISFNYVYLAIEVPQGTFNLKKAIWLTETAQRQVPHIAIVICTYKREAQLAVNISILDTFISTQAEPLYNVIVVDNGNTVADKNIIPQYADGRFKLYTNSENLGGSGGFGRGMCEASAQDKYTHVLLMDDDIFFHPEMLLRLEYFLRHAKNPEKIAIGGVMLDKNNPATIVEWGVCFSGHPVGIRRGECATAEQNLLPPRELADYCAWTFFCYPLTDMTKGQEPLDFFIRADDAEFGLRLAKKFDIQTITRQGLAVWHHAFAENSPLVTFYTIRNELNVNRLYGTLTVFIALRFALVPLYFLLRGKFAHAKAAWKGILSHYNCSKGTE